MTSISVSIGGSLSVPRSAKASFSGVKKSPSGAFYYDDNDVSMKSVPIANCEGDYPLKEDELKRYFGVEPSRMAKLPEYYIIPRLHSTLVDPNQNEIVGAMTSGGSGVVPILGRAVNQAFAVNEQKHVAKSGSKQWYITGEVIVYTPVEWVPIVRETRTIPKNHFEAEYNRTTTMIKTTELYGSGEASFTMSIGGGWNGLKLELSNTTSLKASYTRSNEYKEEIKQKGRLGNVVIKEVVMGMCLRMKRVYERSIHLILSKGQR